MEKNRRKGYRSSDARETQQASLSRDAKSQENDEGKSSDIRVKPLPDPVNAHRNRRKRLGKGSSVIPLQKEDEGNRDITDLNEFIHDYLHMSGGKEVEDLDSREEPSTVTRSEIV